MSKVGRKFRRYLFFCVFVVMSIAFTRGVSILVFRSEILMKLWPRTVISSKSFQRFFKSCQNICLNLLKISIGFANLGRFYLEFVQIFLSSFSQNFRSVFSNFFQLYFWLLKFSWNFIKFFLKSPDFQKFFPNFLTILLKFLLELLQFFKFQNFIGFW